MPKTKQKKIAQKSSVLKKILFLVTIIILTPAILALNFIGYIWLFGILSSQSSASIILILILGSGTQVAVFTIVLSKLFKFSKSSIFFAFIASFFLLFLGYNIYKTVQYTTVYNQSNIQSDNQEKILKLDHMNGLT